MKCEICGKTLYGNSKMCLSCEGNILRRGIDVGLPRPDNAGFASLLIPGWGQISNGQTSKGILFFIITTLALLSILIIGDSGLLLFFGCYSYNVFEAKSTAKAKFMNKMKTNPDYGWK